MAHVSDLARMLEMAEQAAMAGDLASAEQLLRAAAERQESELGPLHPDLANTLNNLGIVAEQSGRADEAETFYRRAVAMTSASLPADHPMVAASRENLEAFCRARGIPIAAPVATPPAAPAPPGALAMTLAPPTETTTAIEAAHPVESPDVGGSSPSRAWMAIAAVVLLASALAIWRPWSSDESSPPPPTTSLPATPTTTAPLPPAPPQASARAQPDRGQSPAAAAPAAPPTAAPAPAPAATAISLVSAQLCRTFSTSRNPWRCDPVSGSPPPGPLVLYTRIRSPRDVQVAHRWYRGDALRQSVTLTIRASAKEGFRTYSRQTVNSGDWRVEVRSADGALLHEARVTVR